MNNLDAGIFIIQKMADKQCKLSHCATVNSNVTVLTCHVHELVGYMKMNLASKLCQINTKWKVFTFLIEPH